jgi:hypothetical protein
MGKALPVRRVSTPAREMTPSAQPTRRTPPKVPPSHGTDGVGKGTGVGAGHGEGGSYHRYGNDGDE